MQYVVAILCVLMGTARAEVPEIRFAQQFSMGYLQFDVMRHRDLLQKHAAALGIPEVKVSYVVFNGPDMMNDALLSGAVDIASGGIPGLLTIWDKTHGTAREVKGIAPMSRNPILLTSREARIRTILDFRPDDRIAMPAARVSAQAVLLEMAAAKEWGDAAYNRLDAQTFSMSPPDATAAILSGRADFAAAFTVPPYQDMQLRDPAVHVVLSSDDVLGSPSSSGTAWTSKQFHDANPALYRALLDAMEEASGFIPGHERETAEYYAADTKGKIDIDQLVGLLKDPRFQFVLAPKGTMKWAEFLGRVGRMKNAPASWKDLFWPELHDRDGS